MTAPPPKESSIDDELPEYLVDHPRARTGSAHGARSPRGGSAT